MTKLEQVARAIYDQIKKHDHAVWIGNGSDLTDIIIDGHVSLIDVARAALAAMDVPTPEMVDAGADAMMSIANPGEVYTAMIRKAMEE